MDDRNNYVDCSYICPERSFLVQLFLSERKKAFNRLQQMLDCAIDGELERTEVSEEKYSALENSMKQYIDSSFLAGKNQQEQKEVIQKLISDIAHQTLTPISNLTNDCIKKSNFSVCSKMVDISS